ncbi:LamG-like jellyroll fold domain-containing protein [Plantactinospora mayteni]|uniref:LamG-like jellyroll fold domain-containing protein n=1 Tax=Plantactinospora mayteni TaxID=566021 RepID=UPI001944110C|nr:LamG-like jellyroll fold domain-containing protein [Plantactinospora mayteni]
MLLTAVVPLAGSAVTSTPETDRGSAPLVRETPDPGSAVRAAAAQGTPVRVANMTTPTRVVDARPDGTMTATLHAYPQRVPRDGRWLDLDTALVRHPDKTVRPRAVGSDLVLSGGGGTAPLVRYGRDGRWMALAWPGTLPAPVLAGAVATYPEVLPGVDLVMRAEVDGYSQHLVVKSAVAARQPALRRIRLGLSTQDLKVTATRAGALEARDASGTLVVTAPPSVMWDSAGKVARVGVALAGSALVLTPDQALLRDPRTRFPVTIDPRPGDPPRDGWTKVFTGYPDMAYWNGNSDDQWAKVGKCDWAACNDVGVARSYFQFFTDFLAGKQILHATFDALVGYGPSCNTRPHQLLKARSGIYGGTTWNNAPQGDVIATQNVGSNYEGCAGDKPVGFDVRGHVNAGGITTYFLKAADETDKYAWRRYKAEASVMRVTYNSQPDLPRALGMDPPLPQPCRWCGGIPYVAQPDVRFEATLTDQDGDNLYAAWRTRVGGVENAWNGGWMANGDRHSTPISLAGYNGKRVEWWMHGHDGYLESAAGGGQPFVVDLDRPGSAPGVVAALYQDDNRWHGGVGVPGRFTFLPVAPGETGVNVNDIDHYQWGFDDQTVNKVDASSLGGPATVSIAPIGDGARTLFVRSVDRAGNRSDPRMHRFYVRAGNGPLAQWSLDGNLRDTGFLGDRDGTATGPVAYGNGAVGPGLRLDGTGKVGTPSTVRTDDSFSVTAWVRLDRADGATYGLVSQHGANNCAFCLQYMPDRGWTFALPHADQASPPGWSFLTAPAIAGEWTHLAGVYDAAEQKIRLYVNGRLAGTTPHIAPWHTEGRLEIGSGMAGGIDEVKVYDRPLSVAEVNADVTRDNVQLGHWKFDPPRDGGRAAPNAVPGGTSAVLHGGARYITSPNNGAVKLGGADDYVGTGTPVLRTDRSFTVGGWLWLDEVPTVAGGASTAVTQDGAVNGGFYLGYRHSDGGRWEFYLPSADAVTRPADSAVISAAGTAKPRQWTHVMSVYDAESKRIELYVDGRLAASATRAAGFNATGELVVGRMRMNGSVGNTWNGAVDELRAYSRVLSAAEIQGIVTQSAVTAGQWRLDSIDGAGLEIPDSSGRGLTGKVEGGVTLVGGQSTHPDPSDKALRLDGATGAASAPHAVGTNRSFSATAWVRLDRVGDHHLGVVSQDGQTVSSFRIEAEPGKQWSFVMFTRDVEGGGEARRAIGGAAQVGVWTHLAAVYDAEGGRMHLYVNGVLAATQQHSNAWDYPTGRVQIGRSRWAGTMFDYFPGVIDDVALYSRTLFAEEIRVLAGRDLSLVHNWALNEPSGTSAGDSVGARPGTLAGGAAFTSGRVGNGVTLPGTGDVSTQGVDLRTDASFTVAAWAYLTAKDCDLKVQPECKVDLVSIDGANTSKFRLGHVVDKGQSQLGAWIFEMPASDTRGAPATKAAVTTEPADLDRWVHLVGVYDAPSKTYWLYVNGNRIGSGTLNAAWPARGEVRIGRGIGPDGRAGEYWKGRADDVRLYAGVLDSDRVWALYTSYPALQAPAAAPKNR